MNYLTYAFFGGLFIVSLVCSYLYISALSLQRLKDQVKAIAITGAQQFDAKDLEQLQVEGDWRKPEWGKVVKSLGKIRDDNEDILFSYIFRKNPQHPDQLQFIADSHSLNPYANTDTNPANDVDANGDGKIDFGDILQWPGQSYPDPPKEALLFFEAPGTSPHLYQDQWGKMLTGYAPIRDQQGNSIAVLAVDVKQEKFHKLNAHTFILPLIFIFIVFILFLCSKLVSMHKSFLKELWMVFEMRKVIIGLIFCAEVALISTYFIYQHALGIMKEEIGQRLVSIAATAVPLFDPEDIQKIQWAKDMKTDAYQRVFKALNGIRNENPDIKSLLSRENSVAADLLL
jgi:hypothetical protein